MNIRNIKSIGHSGLQTKLPGKTTNYNISLVQLSETLVNAIRETIKKKFSAVSMINKVKVLFNSSQPVITPELNEILHHE